MANLMKVNMIENYMDENRADRYVKAEGEMTFRVHVISCRAAPAPVHSRQQ